MAKVTNQVMACIFELLSRQGGKSNSNRHRGKIARSLQTLVVSVLETKNSIKSKQKLLKSRSQQKKNVNKSRALLLEVLVYVICSFFV